MEDCLFCEIINRQRPARIVYENERVLAFEDIRPQAPTHTLIIPKKHIPSLNDMSSEDNELVGYLFYTAKELAKQKGIDQSGFRTVINTNQQAGQTVYHLHVHLLGGRPMKWPPG